MHIKFYWKILFYFENMFATVLKCYFKFYKTFAIGLKLFGFKMQNLWKKKKTEIEKGSEQKKREKRRAPAQLGRPGAQTNRAAAQLARFPPRTPSFSFSFSFFVSFPDRWDPPVRVTPNLWQFPSFSLCFRNRRRSNAPVIFLASNSHKYPTYKYPALTFPSPFHLSPIDAAVREKSLAGAPLLHGRCQRLCWVQRARTSKSFSLHFSSTHRNSPLLFWPICTTEPAGEQDPTPSPASSRRSSSPQETKDDADQAP
jgi:hypothetical protein